MNIKKITRFSLVLCSALIIFSACKKDNSTINNGYLPPVTLVDSVTVKYGEKVTLTLPEEYKNLEGVTFKLDFSGNKNLKVNTTDSLNAYLAKWISVDVSKKSLTIDAGQLYPNSNSSALSGVRLPDVYVIGLIAESATGLKSVKTTFKLKVLPAALGIAEISATDPVPYGYSLYQDGSTIYTVDDKGLSVNGTTLILNQNGYPDGHITLNGHKIIVDATAGDDSKKAEWTYDLVPTLTRDGYTVAYKQFRIVLMAKPKFFYGTYYPQYDLTVVQNRIVIGLSNVYNSPLPVFNPEKYKGSFALNGITKDGIAFTDATKIFSVDAATGKVSVLANSILTAGEYKLTVVATAKTGLLLTADLTLVME